MLHGLVFLTRVAKHLFHSPHIGKGMFVVEIIYFYSTVKFSCNLIN
jgi:hypothetical protein